MNHVLNTISPESFLLLLDIAVKSCLLLLLILIAAQLMRKSSAATLHRLWTLGFLGCLVIPIVGLIAPAWTLPLIPRPVFASDAVEAPDAIITESRDLSEQDSTNKTLAMNFDSARVASEVPMQPPHAHPAGEKTQRPKVTPRQEASEKQPTNTSTAPVTATPQPMPTRVASGSGWLSIGLVVWLFGVAVCLLRIVWQHWLLIRIRRRSTPITDDEWTWLTAEVSQTLQLRRTVKLYRFDDLGSPVCAGIVRPMILLPADADAWDGERRRVVLLHELAHVKRHDLFTQFIAELVCAVLWFNPLGWFGLLQMRKFRELACDDLVLETGERPADYADALLDVARSYRSRGYATAVGMIRRSKVEARILAVLDQARSRVALSRRMAGLLFATIAVGVWLIGSVSPYAQEVAAQTGAEKSKTQQKVIATAQPAARDKAEAQQESPKDGMRQMEILVRDEAGEPLAGARMFVNVLYVEGYDEKKIPKNYSTDSDGSIVLTLPKRLEILQLWVRKAGYVPEYANFSSGTHDVGEKLPDQFAFELAEGTTLSGRVIDEAGQAISSVRVAVTVESYERGTGPMWPAKPEPRVDSWLTDQDAITDDEGRWAIYNAPAQADESDWKFRLKFKHPDYVSDSEWGELQSQQRLTMTTPMFRNGSAAIILSRGVEAVGTVQDASGNPVKLGLVIWHSSPYFSSGVHETPIDESGHFKTLPLSPGEYPFTIIAPGFQPHLKQVKVAKSMDELNFKLKPGKRLTLKIVDQQGNLIPEAHVGIRRWRFSESLYNYIHSNVPDSRIPTRADENGLYVWEWAPEDAVEYQISAKGFTYETLTVTAREEPHLVQLSQRLIASGLVTNARTG